MASDASHVLEAALEQMDDIIAGKSFSFIVKVSRDCPVCNCRLSYDQHRPHDLTAAHQIYIHILHYSSFLSSTLSVADFTNNEAYFSARTT